jgi:hypothetical protein
MPETPQLSTIFEDVAGKKSPAKHKSLEIFRTREKTAFHQENDSLYLNLSRALAIIIFFTKIIV